MNKQYKIQLPKGKKVTMTNVDFEDGVMTVNVEFENDFHKVMHDEVCGVFGKINNEWKEVLKANGVTREKIEEMAKESIKELEKDCPDIWDKIIQGYIEAISGKKEQKYEPKDGDFVCYYGVSGSKNVAIFKEKLSRGSRLYCVYNTCGKYLFCKNIIDECIMRHANESEKKVLIDELAKVNKKWNPETKTIEDVRWRAKVGEEYYYVDCFGEVIKGKRAGTFCYPVFDSNGMMTKFGYDDSDIQMYNAGNYFKTCEAAEKAAEQIREVFKNSKAE